MIKTTRFTTESLNDLVKVLKAETLEYLEGTLLDSVLYGFYSSTGNNGYIAVYEQYVNSNMSEYYVEISDTPEDNEKVYSRWYDFYNKYGGDVE